MVIPYFFMISARYILFQTQRKKKSVGLGDLAWAVMYSCMDRKSYSGSSLLRIR